MHCNEDSAASELPCAVYVCQARDDLGNRRLCGGDAFAVHLEGPAHVSGDVTDRANGMYGVRYCATLAGRYQLCILNGACCRPHPNMPTCCGKEYMLALLLASEKCIWWTGST